MVIEVRNTVQTPHTLEEVPVEVETPVESQPTDEVLRPPLPFPKQYQARGKSIPLPLALSVVERILSQDLKSIDERIEEVEGWHNDVKMENGRIRRRDEQIEAAERERTRFMTMRGKLIAALTQLS